MSHLPSVVASTTDEDETEILTRQVLRDRELPEELIGLLDNRGNGNAAAIAECIS